MREFRDENFEDFIKRNADNLRMKAPDRVWESLTGKLSKEKRRFGFGLSAFFLATAVLSYFTINNTSRLVSGPDSIATIEQDAANESTTAPVISMATVPVKRKTFSAGAFAAPKPAIVRPLEAGEKVAVVQPSLTPGIPASNLPGLTAQNTFKPTVVDAHSGSEVVAVTKAEKDPLPLLQVATSSQPWTIESTVNHYRIKKLKQSRFETQFHLTPTISYRKLTENKSYLRTSSPTAPPHSYAALYNNVNNMVTHKPDIGFELGFTEKYSLSQKVRIKAGLQFNVNRYDIKAFQAPYSLASITLNNRRTARVDSLWTVSNYSNVNASSSKSSWLQNFSFQVSAPVGVELALKGNEKMQFGVAGSIQPTYVLGDRTYMITNDYKSYTQIPWLLRRWNVNTAFETYVSYQSGRTRWQVGPQVRYQLLSSFISNYPVKENLFDFGLKIGVSVIK